MHIMEIIEPIMLGSSHPITCAAINHGTVNDNEAIKTIGNTLFNALNPFPTINTMKMLASVSVDQRVLLLIIGWGFGNFMEGMAGFGTAVAIPASMLAAIGINPILSVIACLVVNSTPTAFGSVGVPTVTLASVTNLDALQLSGSVALIQVILTFLSPSFHSF